MGGSPGPSWGQPPAALEEGEVITTLSHDDRAEASPGRTLPAPTARGPLFPPECQLLASARTEPPPGAHTGLSGDGSLARAEALAPQGGSPLEQDTGLLWLHTLPRGPWEPDFNVDSATSPDPGPDLQEQVPQAAALLPQRLGSRLRSAGPAPGLTLSPAAPSQTGCLTRGHSAAGTGPGGDSLSGRLHVLCAVPSGVAASQPPGGLMSQWDRQENLDPCLKLWRPDKERL